MTRGSWSSISSRRLAVAGLAVLSLLTLLVVWENTTALHDRKAQRSTFYDMRLWCSAAGMNLDKNGTIYDTDRPDYYTPGSRAYYKYPPFYASFLRLLRNVVDLPTHTARVFLAIYALTALLVLGDAAHRSRLRWWIGGLALLGWQPLFESWNDLAMEGPILGLLAVGLWALRRSHSLGWGLVVGLAAGIKVYPGALAVLALLRKDWRAVLGVGIGFAFTLAFGMLVLPPEDTIQFYGMILPRIGGVSLSLESVGLLSATGRVLLDLTGHLPSLQEMDLETLASEAPNVFFRIFPWVVWVAVFTPLTLWTWRRFRRRDIQFAAAICLLVASLPTAWSSYQALLVVPWLTALAHIHPRVGNRSTLALAFFLYLGGWISMYHSWFGSWPAGLSLIRTALPFGLWELLRRIDCG